MILINLFDAYFLALMIYVSSVLLFWDYKVFMHYGSPDCAKSARLTGAVIMITAVCLFVLRVIVYLFEK